MNKYYIRYDSGFLFGNTGFISLDSTLECAYLERMKTPPVIDSFDGWAQVKTYIFIITPFRYE